MGNHLNCWCICWYRYIYSQAIGRRCRVRQTDGDHEQGCFSREDGDGGAFAQLIPMPVLTGGGWCGRRREGGVEHALRPRSGYSCHFGQRQVRMSTFLCSTHHLYQYEYRIKAQTEDDLKAKNLEWECFKKKNEDWKEMLAYQRANPTCITLDGEEKAVKKGSSKKSSNKRSSKNHTNDSSEEKKSKLKQETSEMKVKKIPELPRSPRKEGSVLHPYFKKKP